MLTQTPPLHFNLPDPSELENPIVWPADGTPLTPAQLLLWLEWEFPGSRTSEKAFNKPEKGPLCTIYDQVRKPLSINELHKSTLLEWLDLYFYEKQATAVRTCGTAFAHLECPSGHVKYARTSCRRDYCPKCGQKGSKEHERRTIRAVDRLLWAPVLGYGVFTMPKEIQEKRLDSDRLTELTKSVQSIVKRYFPTPGGVCRYHLLGNQQGTFHIHLNVLFPITGTAGKGKVDERVLDNVRKAYTKEINSIFGLKEKVCDIHYSFATTKRKMYHKIKYVMRPIVTTLDFILLSDEEKHFVLGLEGWHNTRWFGKLSNNCYKKFLCASGVDPEAHRKRDTYLSPVCPVCGGRFRFVDMVSKEDLPKNQLRFISDDVLVDRCIYSALHDTGPP
jgi:hypothetical protein